MDGAPRVPGQHGQHGNLVDGGLTFQVLGPVRVRQHEQSLATGSPQQQALLAALLLRRGRTVTAPDLIGDLWGDDPPLQSLAVLRTYASRLRKGLPPGTLISESGGYAVRLPDASSLDLTHAEALAAEAERARGLGELSQARALLGRALSLWDGEPLMNVPGPYAESQRSRLTEWRLQLLESRLDMDLQQGCHAETVSELTALTTAHPLRERLRELLMVALYRSGRQAEALAVYADLRRLLADELGVDPSPGLSELQQRILQADPDLTTLNVEAAAPPPPRKPAQLPATFPDFTGRAGILDDLRRRLTTAEGQGVVVLALAGMAGVGKTSLAVHLAHGARHSFPDGQLYVDLRGTDSRTADPMTVLGAFLRALGTPEGEIPDSLEERAALYRSTLDGRRVLVLLDDARDAVQVRPLLPGSNGCAALVTSRVRMVDLTGATLVDLNPLSPDEALQLLTRIVGEERVSAEREAALDVVTACDFLPLAIRIAAARLAARRTWTVAVLAAKLADAGRRLDELRAGDLAVRVTFDLAYQQSTPAQARAFRLLALAEGPDISLAAAAAALDLRPDDAEDLLEELVDSSLLESHRPGRYRYHDLLRQYARERAQHDEPRASDREAVLARLLDFYRSTAVQVYAGQHPGDRLVEHLAPVSRPGLVLDSHQQALDWLFTEGPALLATARQASGTRLLPDAVDLLLTVRDLAESGSDLTSYQRTATELRDAAAAAGDARAELRARAALARTHWLSGHYRQADEEAAEAMALAESADDPWITAEVRNTRGVIALHTGRFAEGETQLRQVLEDFRALADEPALARTLCNLSTLHLSTGRPDEAVALAHQAVEIADRLGHPGLGAHARYALGRALTGKGAPGDALDQFRAALEVFRNSRQRLWQAAVLLRIAEAQLALGAVTEGVASAELSLTMTRDLGREGQRADTLMLLGRALDELGQSRRARACWTEARSLYQSLGSPEATAVGALLGDRTEAPSHAG